MSKKLRTLAVTGGTLLFAGLLCGAALPSGDGSLNISISRVNTVTTGDVPLTTYYFEDSKLIDYLKQYDVDNNSKLSDSELKKITEMTIYGNSKITSVTGIANLRYLTKFVTYSNTLTVLDLTSCPKLEYVDFSNTAVTSFAIDFSPNVKEVIGDHSKIWRSETSLGCQKLQTVSFVGCSELTRIIYQDMPALTEITCTGCSKLSKINIKNCSALLKMDISDSENINDLEVTGCTKLKQLFMSSMDGGEMILFPDTLVLDDTQIASYFPVENFRGMKHCSLRGIKVTGDMDLKYNPNLEYLDLDGAKYVSVTMTQLNKITHLSLNHIGSVDGFAESKCPALKYLDLSGSSLSSIDLSKLPNLEVFKADDTNLKNIDYTKSPSLKTLSLRNTMIESLVDYAGKSVIWNLDLSYCTKLKNVAVKLIHCREFNVSNCPVLTSAFIDATNGLYEVNVKNSSSLKELIIHGGSSSWKTLDLAGAPNIETLEVRDSHVTNFDLGRLSNLKQITLGGVFYYFNNADDKTLDLSSCKNLEEARIEDFSCKTVNLNGLTKLSILYCLSNKFTGVNLSSCTSLKQLYISDDKNLSTLDVSALSNLEVLYCKNDSLKKLDISKNKKLETLNCIGNGLKEIVFPDNFGLLNVTCYNNDLAVLNVYQCSALVELVTMFPKTQRETEPQYSYYYYWDTSEIGLRFDTKTTILSSKPTVGKPSSVKAEAASASSVKVSWSAVSGATGYQVWRGTSATGSFTAVGSVTATNRVCTGLTAGTAYYFKVRAYKEVNGTKFYGGYSSVVSAVPLAVPTGVKATSASATSVKVSWNTLSGVTGYQVWRGTSATGSFTAVGSVTTTSRTCTGLTTGTTYYFKVRAYKEVNGTKYYGAFSSVVNAVPKVATPSGVKAKTVSTTSIEVSWNAVSGATGYQVCRATSATGSFTAVGSVTETSRVCTGLTAGTTYYFKIRAYKEVNGTRYYGNYSSVISGVTKPAAPGNVKAAVASATKINVSWSAATGATGYEVWRSESASGTFTKLGAVTTTNRACPGLTTGKTYYFKVRAYIEVNGEKIYGAYSTVVSATPKA